MLLLQAVTSSMRADQVVQYELQEILIKHVMFKQTASKEAAAEAPRSAVEPAQRLERSAVVHISSCCGVCNFQNSCCV